MEWNTLMKCTLSPILLLAVCGAALAAVPNAARAQEDRKDEYVHAVVRGAGLMPWQDPGVSEAEKQFRAKIEARKDALLADAEPDHPAYYDAAAIARAKENVAEHDWARGWLDRQIGLADDIAGKPDAWIESMLPMEAPAHGYGFTCPNCVGEQSQEATGYRLIRWNYKNPGQFSCRECGTVYPNEAYPETATLELPRTGHRVSYFLNPAEQANPDNRSGELAWHWVGHPVHLSFTGIIREQKIRFMRNAVRALGLAYLFTEEPRHAAAARKILVRYAECYRQWPYRDYWDTYADCDPLYAAWHDQSLPLEWKRHLSEEVYAGDTLEKARMEQRYWGAGRYHPSTDGVSGLTDFVQAYDFTYHAKDAAGNPIWDEESRRLVERDLLLEWIMGAEPYLGGPGKAEEGNNKAPRIYNAMAALGKCLGIPEFADVALRGYEKVRDASFLFDGFSTESPSYTNMYLSQLLIVPETLHGYPWPERFTARTGTVNLYEQDRQLRMMYRAVPDTLLPGGAYLPLSDTRLHSRPSAHVLQMGSKRYPEIFGGLLPHLRADSGGEYAVFQLSDEALHADREMAWDEICFPAWKTAILRHASAAGHDTLTLAFNPPGGHRHRDNLALFYDAAGTTLLGDHGYLGDMPVNHWIRNTPSHNLVIVDGQDQEFGGRATDFGFMATSPLASVVEASSTAYPRCSEYRRRVVLVKTGNETFALDLFSVRGGKQHRFRVYSELASSDAPEGELAFRGVAMPPEPPLPEVGASLAREDIYGLRDIRSTAPGGGAWEATWKQEEAAYRLWMATPCDAVEAANGPGQRTHQEAGRRVRYVDALRRGEEGLASLYLAAHESRRDGRDFPIQEAARMPVDAGPRAAAMKVRTNAGVYYALHDFDTPMEVGGIRFQGQFALVFRPDTGAPQYLAIATRQLEVDGETLVEGPPVWRSAASRTSDTTFEADEAAPDGWTFAPGKAQAYARVLLDENWTAFPIEAIAGGTVTVRRFPAQAISALEIPAVVYRGAPRP